MRRRARYGGSFSKLLKFPSGYALAGRYSRRGGVPIGFGFLTGSHQFELTTPVAQSLAGRTALLRLLPFTLAEATRLLTGRRPGSSSTSLPQTLLTGFLSRIDDRGRDPSQALADYFSTYVQRDLRQLAAVHDLQRFERFERFVRLCAGRTGARSPVGKPL